jgi:CubicO group peptidase (beta-lactamase class C family)
VVEQITGKPLNEYMTEAVFTPLGMTNSSYIWKPDFDALTATGHEPDGKPAEKWKPKEAGAASTLNTTARDYALFVEARTQAGDPARDGDAANRTRSNMQNLHQART